MDAEIVKSGVLGLVVGDALGVPVEFRTRAALDQDPVTGMRANGTHRQTAGTWSDDSSMALCVLESLTRGVDYEDMMARFFRWANEGYMTAHGTVFDMGIATQKAITEFRRGRPVLECGGSGERDNGNGSLMRILPAALYLHAAMGGNFSRRAEAYEIIHNSSALTHAHPISLIACGIYCAVVGELLQGGGTAEDIQRGIETAKAFYRTQPELAPVLEWFRRVDMAVLSALPREEIQSSGYVLHTLETSLWCLLHTEDYAACVLAAVNLGEDTDTTAAVAGGLAGLKYGLPSIPAEWLEVLARRTEIEGLCEEFAAAV